MVLSTAKLAADLIQAQVQELGSNKHSHILYRERRSRSLHSVTAIARQSKIRWYWRAVAVRPQLLNLSHNHPTVGASQLELE
ncbi:hypothetical protein BDP55DRAFT_670852 [Colletotrichum godetiae]|uniref:Uncharacterized protein n=1 Tax=Colletotrichum godetiae TaxID=1209918 RepID=A0AAJ0ETH3_9PEZI|nr:uncharacterized protein BDP55DRAFT_670852 [Colletotrichum godetiae]KAK1673328.1 hypothetical protein BDP55DRAFT_670852 [Colletotrichum godetiae]